jgi:hypothetical protein
MRELFQAFEHEQLDYLLIGGQATIIYGAADFTQDVDIWIRSDVDNFQRLLRALASCRARIHKLTPPLTLRWARRGHGFHFLVPAKGSRVPLDVMARPPRVRGFGAAKKRARIEDTDWGRLPVVAEEDLVLLKRTNRPQDYAIISRLVMLRVARVEKPSRSLLRWASANAFRLEDLADLVNHYGDRLRTGDGAAPKATRRLLALRRKSVQPSRADMAFVEGELLRAMARYIEAGRAYWIPRIQDLRRLRTEGRLWPEGAPVADLIAAKPS